ncbi:MAG: RagB/SusD family nutrient uptake outer membrane protein, partial [Cyclobacteriaceae bacterium]
NTDEVADGRITKGAANHLLSEMYIVNGEYNKAVAAATEVIDNSGYALMTSRFGSRSSELGDVYWDLFRRGNQNRGAGNTEGIWVMQYEYNVTGGGDGDNLPRFIIPSYRNLKTNDGQNAFLGPMNQMVGRGIGWWAASDYMLNQVWTSSATDMRNSQYNIIRDVQVNNPSSAHFGQMLIADGAISDYDNRYNRFWSALFVKSGPINNFPEEVIQDPATGVTTGGANHSFRDRYIMRLAETYLLRAEAYFMLGNQVSAAADINVVRARSNADPVASGDVDLDYILDERARELFLEEHRLLTLYRMNKQIERIRIHNPMYNGTYADNEILDHQNLWPIPSAEIQKNAEAVLAQNPGYAGE